MSVIRNLHRGHKVIESLTNSIKTCVQPVCQCEHAIEELINTFEDYECWRNEHPMYVTQYEHALEMSESRQKQCIKDRVMRFKN